MITYKVQFMSSPYHIIYTMLNFWGYEAVYLNSKYCICLMMCVTPHVPHALCIPPGNTWVIVCFLCSNKSRRQPTCSSLILTLLTRRIVQRCMNSCQRRLKTSWWSTQAAQRTSMSPCWGSTLNVQRTYVRLVHRILCIGPNNDDGD